MLIGGDSENCTVTASSLVLFHCSWLELHDEVCLGHIDRALAQLSNELNSLGWRTTFVDDR